MSSARLIRQLTTRKAPHHRRRSNTIKPHNLTTKHPRHGPTGDSTSAESKLSISSTSHKTLGTTKSEKAYINEEELCARCASIDFDIILTKPMKRPYRFILNLGDGVETYVASSCPLCRFFSTILPAKSAEFGYNDGSEYCLLAFSSYYGFLRGFGPVCPREWDPVALFLGFVWAGGADLKYMAEPPYTSVEYARSANFRYRFQESLLQTGYISPSVGSSTFVPRSPVGRSLSAKSVDFTIVKSWIDICKSSHGSICNSEQSSPFASYTFIDCSSRSIADVSGKHEYLALSYVWGRQEDQAPNNSTNRLAETLPQVIEDAIKATLSLGFRYLWVDRYCIRRESSSEMHHQIRNMDSIYRNAQATLIAIAGKDADFGLPGMGRTPRTQQQSVRVGRNTLVSSMSPVTMIETSTWITRGWTYQEGVLSKRRLFFTEQQVYFECKSTSFYESIWIPPIASDSTAEGRWRADSAARKEPLPRPVCRGLFQSPWEHIRVYSRRKLTYEWDTLNAILGILRALETADPGTLRAWETVDNNSRPSFHFQGIPVLQGGIRHGDSNVSEAFARELCWKLSEPAPRRAGFPSWSWTGWASGVEGPIFVDWGRGRRKGLEIWAELTDGRLAKLDEIHRTSLSESLYPHISSYLHVKTGVIELHFQYFCGWEPPSFCAVFSAENSPVLSPLNLTRKIDGSGSSLKGRLETELFEGLIVSYTVDPYGILRPFLLVVGLVDGSTERIGLVDTAMLFRWREDEKNYGRTYDDFYIQERTATIRLG
jgi:Heterokaryon incompatibility protein (HET)